MLYSLSPKTFDLWWMLTLVMVIAACGSRERGPVNNGDRLNQVSTQETEKVIGNHLDISGTASVDPSDLDDANQPVVVVIPPVVAPPPLPAPDVTIFETLFYDRPFYGLDPKELVFPLGFPSPTSSLAKIYSTPQAQGCDVPIFHVFNFRQRRTLSSNPNAEGLSVDRFFGYGCHGQVPGSKPLNRLVRNPPIGTGALGFYVLLGGDPRSLPFAFDRVVAFAFPAK